MKSVLILGAGSDVGVALAKVFAQQGATVTLAGRDIPYLETIAADLRIRYTRASVYVQPFDAVAYDTHAAFYAGLPQASDVTICVFGYLGDQEKAQQDFAESRKIIESNYVGAVSILNVVAEDYQRKGSGVIVGVSSVAGDRGRQSNYVYGSAKAGFTAYLSGLRNRLVKNNVHVMTLKPGFIKTKMVAGLHTPPALTALPDKLAAYVYKAIGKKRNVVYYLPLWRYIMTIIVLIPESIFKKLKL
ncbi:SDR family oxidoreductase [Fulvivirgaceae bacterium PWU5]|uniref:SDR family oxidoreductase n=1 Tax=Dawidia cretensis TaxID=2782350 RepID=A0AAP2DUF3_9BACT|nr:SDR family oxidoreductase [Dawidia cretensis]MBT1707436.1 SDR family oxidoreductase [Dawidia cretensis]